MESRAVWWEDAGRGRATAAVGEIVAAMTVAPVAYSFLVLMLATDVALISVHVLHSTTPAFGDPNYSLDAERGFAGVVMSLKEMWLTLILGWLFLRSRRPLFLTWGVFYGYLTLDDWFSVHEKLGGVAVERLGLAGAFGLRGQDFGELLVSAAAGAVLLGALLWGHWRSTPGLRRVGLHLAALLGLLLLFGIGTDMLHSISMGSWLDPELLVVEEGGELLAMSLICGYAYSVLQRRPGRRREEGGFA